MAMGRIRPYLGDWVEADELYVAPGRLMPTLASSLVVETRQKTGLTQVELAERAGVSRSAISAIEHGKRDPGLEYLQRILAGAGYDLHCSLADHDDHDDVLRALGARLTPEALQARNAAAQRFGEQLQEGAKHSRPLLSP